MVSSLRTDSPLCRSIVSSFLQFLGSVDASPGQDVEGIEVAAQCLAEVFGLDNQRSQDEVPVVSLIDLFTSMEFQSPRVAHHAPSAPTAASLQFEGTSRGGEGPSLLGQFKEGLELAGFYDGMEPGAESYEQKVKQLEETARAVIKEAREKVRAVAVAPSWSKSYPQDTLVLAEAFKIQGNKSVSANQFHAAIQLYTLALSLCNNNAIFHSNRAAALTAVGKYEEAIADCHAAMKLDPLYCKAYSRLGHVYYAQGKIADAIEKGFKKALELDPTSTSIQENLRAAQQKLEEQQRQEQQAPQSQGNGGPNEDTAGQGGRFNFQLPREVSSFLPDFMTMIGQQLGEQVIRNADAGPESGYREASQSGQNQQNGGNHESQNDQGGFPGGSEFRVSFNGQELPPQYSSIMQNALQQILGSAGSLGGGVNSNTNPQDGTERGR